MTTEQTLNINITLEIELTYIAKWFHLYQLLRYKEQKYCYKKN